MALVDLETPAALVQNHRGRLQSVHVFVGVWSAGEIPLLFSPRMPHAQHSHSDTAGRRPAQPQRCEPLERAGIKSWSGNSFISSSHHECPQFGSESGQVCASDGRLNRKQEGRRLCEAVDCHLSGHRGRGKFKTPFAESNKSVLLSEGSTTNFTMTCFEIAMVSSKHGSFLASV